MTDEANDDDIDLRDVVSGALEEATEGDDDQPEGRERDAAGRFATKGEREVDTARTLQPGGEQPAAPADAQQQPEGERLLTEDRAPRGWTPAARERWNDIPPDLRSEIIRREEASAQGVRQLQEQFAPMQQFVQNINPMINEALNMGVDPVQYFSGLVNTERLLRNADVPTKFQEILRLADVFGVPLRDVVNASVGQQVLSAPQQNQQPQAFVPPELIQELNAMRQWREQQETQGVTAQIGTFAQDKEFFHDVRLEMSDYLSTGMAQSLEQAYDMACWAKPEVREVMLQRQGVASRQKKAAGASISPNGALDVDLGDDKDDDLSDTVRRAFASSVNGRL